MAALADEYQKAEALLEIQRKITRGERSASELATPTHTAA